MSATTTLLDAQNLMHSAQSERMVVSLMLNQARVEIHHKLMALLSPDDFFIDQHKMIWQIIGSLRDGCLSADPMAVIDHASTHDIFVGGATYVVDAVSDPFAKVWSDDAGLAAAQRIKDFAARRNIAVLGKKMVAEHGISSNADLVQLVSGASERILSHLDDKHTVKPVRLDLEHVGQKKLRAPERHWFVQDWLTAAPTLFAASGGAGKSLIVQQLATSLALAKPSLLGHVSKPARSLIWNCEDDSDEMWRRQERIVDHLGVGIGATGDRLILESRCGVEDNMLMSTQQNRLSKTHVFHRLRQQVNDEKVDVLWLDNIGHVFGGDEILRAHVTAFVSSLNALVTGRSFAVVILGHIARAQGSEFAGSAAWENACRSRWYLGNKLPGTKTKSADEDNAGDPGRRNISYLVRGKTNHARPGDYVRLAYVDGVFAARAEDSGLVTAKGRAAGPGVKRRGAVVEEVEEW